jgi:hypothetical protein
MKYSEMLEVLKRANYFYWAGNVHLPKERTNLTGDKQTKPADHDQDLLLYNPSDILTADAFWAIVSSGFFQFCPSKASARRKLIGRVNQTLHGVIDISESHIKSIFYVEKLKANIKEVSQYNTT